ncbi:MAG: ATP-dependent Clp protease proteolytic subunit [Clostridia bacterium]|nr:ATP-dependent Clp protease proteolytic subunit [Clostridia bacterium]
MNFFKNEADTTESRAQNTAPVGENLSTPLCGKEGAALSCITIIGQIEGHYLLSNTQKTTKYEHILPLLAAIEDNPEVQGLLIIINTVGGDVEAGLAIAEMIAGMKTPTASIVIGGGHSIGIPIAVSCDHSFIVPSATMTVHPVRTSGTVLGVPEAFEGLQKMQDRITEFVLGHSHITEKAWHELIYSNTELVTDVGTILEGKNAVALGLVDEIGGLSAAMAWLRRAAKEKKESEAET